MDRRAWWAAVHGIARRLSDSAQQQGCPEDTEVSFLLWGGYAAEGTRVGGTLLYRAVGGTALSYVPGSRVGKLFAKLAWR